MVPCRGPTLLWLSPGLGKLEKPEGNFAWSRPNPGALSWSPRNPTAPFRPPDPMPGRVSSPTGTPVTSVSGGLDGKAFFGLVAPMTEVATLVRLSRLCVGGAIATQHAPARASRLS